VKFSVGERPVGVVPPVRVLEVVAVAKGQACVQRVVAGEQPIQPSADPHADEVLVGVAAAERIRAGGGVDAVVAHAHERVSDGEQASPRGVTLCRRSVDLGLLVKGGGVVSQGVHGGVGPGGLLEGYEQFVGLLVLSVLYELPGEREIRVGGERRAGDANPQREDDRKQARPGAPMPLGPPGPILDGPDGDLCFVMHQQLRPIQ